MATGQAAGSQTSNSEKKAAPALAYMLAAVIAFSLIPLAIKLAGGEQAPFLFAASWQTGIAVGCLFVLIVRYRTSFHASNLGRLKAQLFPSGRGADIRRVSGWWRDYRVLLAIIVNFEYALLAWSVQFIDITVSIILFGLWPIFLALLGLRSNGVSAPRWPRREDRQRFSHADGH